MNLNIPLNDIHSNVCKYLFSYYNTFYVRFIFQKNVTREVIYPLSHGISSPAKKKTPKKNQHKNS